ncbi:MAG: copper homeostasis protein CutC [Asticcacaulis sp.]
MSPALSLEVCVDTPEGLLAAVRGGADRIELCAALSEGGLTPSIGLMRLAAETACPTRAMIRPRTGGFVYSAAETDVMRRDIDAAREAGLSGVVFGASLADGRLDTELLHRLCDHATGLEQALHRAVDLTPDPYEAVDHTVALGFATILSSGGARRAEDGLDRLSLMTGHAAGRIEIMPGGGVTADNALKIATQTGALWLHASCGQPMTAPTDAESRLGLLPPGARDTDEATVRRLSRLLRGGSAQS